MSSITNKSKFTSKPQKQFDPNKMVQQYEALVEQLSHKENEKQYLQNQLSQARKQIAELKLLLNQEKTKGYEYQIASQRMLKRQEQLVRQLQKLRRVYGSQNLKLKSVQQKKKLIKNSFNFQNVVNKQYQKTVQQYKQNIEQQDSELESGSNEDQEEENKKNHDTSVRNDQYYKKLLYELREEIEILNKNQTKLEYQLSQKQKQITMTRSELKKQNMNLMLEITSWKQRNNKQQEQNMIKMRQLNVRNETIQRQNKELIKKMQKQTNIQSKRKDQKLNQLKKEVLEKNNNSEFIKSQYERMQQIYQNKIKQFEAKIQEIQTNNKKVIKSKDLEIIKLKNQIDCIDQKAEKQNKRKNQNLDRNQEQKIPHSISKQKQTDRQRKNKKSPKKKQKKLKESNSQDSLDIKTVQDIKFHIKNLEKLIDQTKQK